MPDDWRNFLLRAIGAPENPVTLGSLTAWAHSEGIVPGCHNHLAASDQIPGTRPGPTPSIPCYIDEGTMISLYANKLRSGIYQGIYDALRRGDSYADVWQAINKSPWCARCQGGKYPIALYAVAFQSVAPPLSTPLGTEGIEVTPARGTPIIGTGKLPSDNTGPKFDDLFRSWDRLTHALGVTVPHAYWRVRTARRGIERAVRLPRG